MILIRVIAFNDSVWVLTCEPKMRKLHKRYKNTPNCLTAINNNVLSDHNKRKSTKKYNTAIISNKKIENEGILIRG